MPKWKVSHYDVKSLVLLEASIPELSPHSSRETKDN